MSDTDAQPSSPDNAGPQFNPQYQRVTLPSGVSYSRPPAFRGRAKVYVVSMESGANDVDVWFKPLQPDEIRRDPKLAPGTSKAYRLFGNAPFVGSDTVGGRLFFDDGMRRWVVAMQPTAARGHALCVVALSFVDGLGMFAEMCVCAAAGDAAELVETSPTGATA